jgi:hypothetical protein
MNSLIQDLRWSAIVPAIRHEVAALDKSAAGPVSGDDWRCNRLGGSVGHGPFRLQLAVRGAMVVAVRCATDRHADVRQRVRNPDHRGLLGQLCSGPTRRKSMP